MAPFLKLSVICTIVIVVHPNALQQGMLLFKKIPQVKVVTGGHTRMDSVRAGLAALKEMGMQDDDWVMVHDAARPCITVADIEKLYSAVTTHEKVAGGILAVPVADTLKIATADRHIASTLSREHVWRALTPQMFRIGVLSEAMDAG